MMKIKMFCGAIALMFVFAQSSCSKTPAGTFLIEGKLSGLAEGTVLELLPGATHKDEKPVATAKVIGNGEFSFKGSVPAPRMFYLQVAGSYGMCTLMVDNNEIKLHGVVTMKEVEGSKYYDFSGVKVKGSVVHDEFLKKMAPRYDLDRIYTQFSEKHSAISAEISKARMANNQALSDSIMASPEGQELSKGENMLFDSVVSISTKIITSNSESWWGPLLMMHIIGYFTPNENALYEKFSPAAKESYYGKLVKEELLPEGLSGKPAPEFTLVNAQEKELKSSELMKGKKYVLVDFWASWCNPCRKEIPNLKKLYEKYAPKGLEIISISIDKKEADWKKAMEEEKLPWPSFLDKKDVASIYNVKFIPAIFLIDEQGMLLSDKLRGEELAVKLEELFR